jgi:DNA mismatch endonuclease (patch repair protein)
MDIWTKKKRSAVMSKILSKDTKPEKLVRSLLHNAGYRFNKYRKDLPGRPDIVLPKYRTVIFVHGCFWHYHSNCPEGRIPDTNSKYWKEKLVKNVERDKKNKKALLKLGWKVLVIWECEIENNKEKTFENILSKLNLNNPDQI